MVVVLSATLWNQIWFTVFFFFFKNRSLPSDNHPHSEMVSIFPWIFCCLNWSLSQQPRWMCLQIFFSPITNSCNYSGLDLSWWHYRSWARGCLLLEISPPKEWKTVESTNIYIHTDSSGDEEVVPWSCTDISFLEPNPDSSLERKGVKKTTNLGGLSSVLI